MHKLVGWKKFSTGLTIALLLSTGSLPAYAEKGKECVDINKDKITDTLKKVNIPAAEILSITSSPIHGLCEIGFQSQGKIGVLYTNNAFEYLIFGNLIDTKAMINLTEDRTQKLQDLKRVDLAKITLNEGLAVGKKGATKKVIIFTDPD